MTMRFVLVDDNSRFLRAARSLLEKQGIAVVGVASTGEEAVRRAEELRPDVLLVDIDLGSESGFDVTRQLTTAGAASVILISTHAEQDFADLIAASPAVGFISKSALSATTIHQVLKNRTQDRSRHPRSPGDLSDSP